MTATLLLHGHDTIECAYYLAATPDCTLNYEQLAVEKEEMRLSKIRPAGGSKSSSTDERYNAVLGLTTKSKPRNSTTG